MPPTSMGNCRFGLRLACLLVALGSLAPLAALAWTSEEIARVTPDRWVLRDIQYLPQPSGAVKIRYRVVEDAYVIIRAHASFPPFPLLRHIVPRALRTPGNYEEVWDAHDESGRPVSHFKAQVVVRAEPVNFQPAAHELEGALANPPVAPALAISHHLHNPALCGVLAFTAEIPAADTANPEVILVRRLGAVAGYGAKVGLGIKVFVNERFAGELMLPPADAAAASTYRVPVRLAPLLSGANTVHVVMTDFADHFGAVIFEYRKP